MIRAAIALLAGLLAALPAVAAPAGPYDASDQVPSDLLVSDLKLGPFYVKPSFVLQDVGIDNNVFLTSSDPQKDFTATFVPGIRLALPVGDSAAWIDQTVSYVYYNDLEDERTWNYETAFRGDFVIGSMRLGLGERLLRSSDHYNVEVVTRTRRIENRFEARLGTDHDAGVYFEGYGAHGILRFDSGASFAAQPIAETLDRNELRAGGAAFVEAGPARVVGGAEIARNRFRITTTGRDSDGYFVYSGLRFEPDRTVSGEIDVGYQKLEFDRPGQPSFSGLAFRGDLAIEVGDASRMLLYVARRPEYSVQTDVLHYQLTSVSLRLRIPAGDRFALELGPELSRTHYPSVPGREVPSNGRYNAFDVSGLVGVSEGTALRLGFLYRSGTSALTGTSYDGLALTTGLEYGR